MSIETVREEEINGEAGHVELEAGDVQVYITHVQETVSIVAVDPEEEWQGSVVIKDDDGRRVRGDPA